MIGKTLGPYRILDKLGEGGTGEVYRARDTKLDREVAIKVLSEAFAGDRDRFVRFQREAKMLAALNHPHIAQIYGVEDAGDTQALVMELVDGVTLADRIAAGPVPLDEALAIAKQIAEGLEAAHALAIIHRDLKPANTKVRSDGTVKVLDFGLAKALEPVGTTGAGVSLSPTLSIHATQAGLILGTAAYMSPEQARGKAADTRSDVWAFGVVLFEMLAGRRPVDGDEISDTLASILKSEPNWQCLPSDTPPAIRRLLRRCLEKDSRQRLQHIGDARLEIEEAQRGTPSDSAFASSRVTRRERLAWAAAIGVALSGALGAATWWAPAVPNAPEMRLEVSTPEGLSTQFAVSPDGRAIAYAGGGQPRQIWLRGLDGTSPRRLSGTEGGEYPFWSPDGRSIGFFANAKLKRIDVEGGAPQLLANVRTPAGGTWSSDGIILYVPSPFSGVFAVAAIGGETREVTPTRRPNLATRLPQFLPNGRHFLFYVAQGGEPPGVYIGELGRDAIRRILSADWPAVYGSGHLWFVRESTLFAQRFDPETQELSGPVIRVADNVGTGLFDVAVSVSANGPTVYRAGGTRDRTRRLAWFDRAGKPLGTSGDKGFIFNPSLSADGRYVVVGRTVQENADLWLIDLQRNVSTRLTDQPGIDNLPLWSPDGSRVLFNHSSADGRGLFILRLDGTARYELLHDEDGTTPWIACDWSPDGQFILYKQTDEAAGATDLWAVRVATPNEPFRVVATPSDERDGQFSPDGKWIAYESDEAGRPQIYLQPFPGPGPKVPVSTEGGSQVRWRRDGKEIFYIAPDQSLMAVPINTAAGASGVGTPKPLFKTSIAPTVSRQQYVVAPDGKRFLIVTIDDVPVPPLTLILNWKGGVRP